MVTLFSSPVVFSYRPVAQPLQGVRPGFASSRVLLNTETQRESALLTGLALPNLPLPSAVALSREDARLQAQASQPYPVSLQQMQRLSAESHKERGTQLFLLGYNDLAISEYQQALYAKPSYTDASYNMAKVYLSVGDYRRAAGALNYLLGWQPEDVDSRCLLAEAYIREAPLLKPPLAQANYNQALKAYQTALQASPCFDPARRGLAYLQAQLAAQSNPQQVQQQYLQHASQTLKQAKLLVADYYQKAGKPMTVSLLNQVAFQFAATEDRKRTANLAEFDFNYGQHGIIRIKPELAYANPVVLAAYLTHEMIHATDQDAISSIVEEQDAYREQAKFWKAYRGQEGCTIADPNLDLAVNLAEQSVDKLDQEVRRSYQDDALLPEKSPGHGLPKDPQSLIEYNRAKLEKLYDVQNQRIKSLLPMNG